MPAAALDGVLELFTNRALSVRHLGSTTLRRPCHRRTRSRKVLSNPDDYIAAIGTALYFTVVSSDTSAFTAASLGIINPWATGV